MTKRGASDDDDLRRRAERKRSCGRGRPHIAAEKYSAGSAPIASSSKDDFGIPVQGRAEI